MAFTVDDRWRWLHYRRVGRVKIDAETFSDVWGCMLVLMATILAKWSRSATDLAIYGVDCLNRCLNTIDPELGGSGDACGDLENFLKLQALQENRSMATKPFRHTKVSILSLDVPGDEIVH